MVASWFETQTIVFGTGGSGDDLIDKRQVVESLFHEETDDTVAVEDEVSSLRFLVSLWES